MEEKKANEAGEKDSFYSRYDTVLSFLGLEVLCLGFFALGGSLGSTLFRLLGFFLSLVTLGYLRRNQSEQERKRYWIALIPFLALALLTGLSRFFLTGASSLVGGIATDLTVSFGLIGFFLLGQGLKQIPVLKRDVILLSIGCGLALMVLIPGLYSLIRYGFFYAARYQGMVYYYDGVVFPIANETKVLSGFSFLEASLSYGKAPAFLLGLSGIGCFYLSPKEETKRFLAFLLFGLLGVLDLAFVPFTKALILLAAVYVFALLLRLISGAVRKKGVEKKADSVFKILYWVFLGLVVLGLILLFIDAFTGAILGNFPLAKIRDNRNQEGGLLNRLAASIRSVFVEETSYGKKLNVLGILFGVDFSLASGSSLTRFFEFNFLWQNGLIAFLLLLFFLFYFIRESYLFLKEDQARMDGKAVVVALLAGALLYFSFFDDEMPYHHATAFLPFSRESLTLLLSFVCGLVYNHKEKKGGAAHE